MFNMTDNSGLQEDAQASDEFCFSLTATSVWSDAYSKGYSLNNLNSHLSFLPVIPKV